MRFLRAADGVMVARAIWRGDESGARARSSENDISRAREFRRPVITRDADAGIHDGEPRPTRAEASDVANAIFDGSDAVMLSAETRREISLEAVGMMARIIEEAEASIREFPRPATREQLKWRKPVAELVCHASRELHMKLIAVFTHSGSRRGWCRAIRPLVPIVAFSPEARRGGAWRSSGARCPE